jgi:hypothetical protein
VDERRFGRRGGRHLGLLLCLLSVGKRLPGIFRVRRSENLASKSWLRSPVSYRIDRPSSFGWTS